MTSKREDREALIEEAADAIERTPWRLGTTMRTLACDRARAALAVFEQAHTPTRHDHDGEPMMWCETHQHVHIARMPRFTYLCKDCGWGQWYGDDAREHEVWTQENLREAHSTYEVEHVMRPLHTPTDAIREALAVLDSHEQGEDDYLERIYRAGNILRAALHRPVQVEPTAAAEFPFTHDGVTLEQDDGGVWASMLHQRPYWIGPRALGALKASGLLADRPQDEPTDAQVLAALTRWFGDHERTTYTPALRDYAPSAVEDMRAALRAAAVTEQGGENRG